MKILITGICGFAGSTIARGLIAHIPGLRLYGIDNLIRKGSESNVHPLRALGIETTIGDIRNPQDLDDLPAVDWVIDCAANPSVLAGVDGVTGSKELLDHNLVGTIHLLEYCRRSNAGFILLSTSRVYSIPPLADINVRVCNNAFVPVLDPINDSCPKASPQGLSTNGVSENFSTQPPVSLYGASKRCSEILAMEYGMTFGFPVRINRCGVLAGGGQFGKADQGIFSYWIHSWARRLPLKYIGFGGLGHQVRDCLHPRDLVPLFIDQMNDPARQVPLILNVSGGTNSAMSLASLSAWCDSRLGHHKVTSESTPRPFDIPWMVLDSSAVSESWKWEPMTATESILEEIAIHAIENPKWLEMTTGIAVGSD